MASNRPRKASGSGERKSTDGEFDELEAGDDPADTSLRPPSVTMTIDFGSLSPKAASAMFEFVSALADTAGMAVGAATQASRVAQARMKARVAAKEGPEAASKGAVAAKKGAAAARTGLAAAKKGAAAARKPPGAAKKAAG